MCKTMERDELRNKFTEVLTIEDQAERSTMLNDMRSEVEKTYKELDDLKVEFIYRSKNKSYGRAE